MAVARVFGRVDGAEVVMEQTQGDIWQVPVPLDQDGEYVVEIIAEDGAGNQSYMAKMLFVVNTALLCVHMTPIPYYASLVDQKLYVEIFLPQYNAVIAEPEYALQLMQPSYYIEIIDPVCTPEGRG